VRLRFDEQKGSTVRRFQRQAHRKKNIFRQREAPGSLGRRHLVLARICVWKISTRLELPNAGDFVEAKSGAFSGGTWLATPFTIAGSGKTNERKALRESFLSATDAGQKAARAGN